MLSTLRQDMLTTYIAPPLNKPQHDKTKQNKQTNKKEKKKKKKNKKKNNNKKNKKKTRHKVRSVFQANDSDQPVLSRSDQSESLLSAERNLACLFIH